MLYLCNNFFMFTAAVDNTWHIMYTKNVIVTFSVNITLRQHNDNKNFTQGLYQSCYITHLDCNITLAVLHYTRTISLHQDYFITLELFHYTRYIMLCTLKLLYLPECYKNCNFFSTIEL